MVSEPKPLAPGREGAWSRSTATRALAALRRTRRCSALVAQRWLERTGADERAPATSRALATGGPLEGAEIPGYTAAGPSEPVKVEDRVLAGFGWQRDDVKLVPADGLERRRADRLARLRRAAGGALAGAPEPRRLLQGDGRRRHQPGDRPRARDRALLDAARCSARRPVDRRPGDRHRARSRPRSRSSSAATTTWRRSPTRPTAGSPASTRPTCSRTSGRSSAAARRRSTSRCSSPRRPQGAIERLKQEAVEEGARRRRAARAHRPHRLRRRAPLPRPAPGDLGDRPGAEAVPGRAGRGEPAPPLLDRAALGGDPQRPRRRHGARPGRRRRLPLRDDRGDLRRRLRARTSPTSARRCARGSRR